MSPVHRKTGSTDAPHGVDAMHKEPPALREREGAQQAGQVPQVDAEWCSRCEGSGLEPAAPEAPAQPEQGERERFEAWFTHGGDYEPEQLIRSGANPDLYMDHETENLWQAFQAGRAASAQAKKPTNQTVAWAVLSDEGEVSMVFLDQAEAWTYCAEGEAPAPLMFEPIGTIK